MQLSLPCMPRLGVSVEDHRRDLLVRGQAKGRGRPAGFPLKRSSFGDACRHETDQPCDLILSDPFHPYLLQSVALFACGGANYRTTGHSSPCPCGFAQLDLGRQRHQHERRRPRQLDQRHRGTPPAGRGSPARSGRFGAGLDDQVLDTPGPAGPHRPRRARPHRPVRTPRRLPLSRGRRGERCPRGFGYGRLRPGGFALAAAGVESRAATLVRVCVLEERAAGTPGRRLPSRFGISADAARKRWGTLGARPPSRG